MENCSQSPPPLSSPILNPWISIWTQPRATIQQIVDSNPRRLVLPLAALNGIAQMMSSLDGRNFKGVDGLPAVGLILVTGTITGIMSLFFISALFYWTGRWFGGKAQPEHIWAAMAWSGLPLIYSMVLWFPGILLFGQPVSEGSQPSNIEGNLLLISLHWVFQTAGVIIKIWGLIILLHCLGQVQRFSAWTALGNILLAISIPFIAISAVILVFMVLA